MDTSAGTSGPTRPNPTTLQGQQGDEPSNSTLRPDPATGQGHSRKKRNHRGGKKKRNRRQSFAAPSDDGSAMAETSQSRGAAQSAARSSFYRLKGRNMSNTSIESETLLDHRYAWQS